MRRSSMRICGVSRGRGRCSRMPGPVHRPGQQHKLDHAGDADTPQASACPTVGTYGGSASMKAIERRL